MENLLTMLTNNSGTVNIENNPERGLMSRLEGLYDHIQSARSKQGRNWSFFESHCSAHNCTFLESKSKAESRLLAQSSEHGADR